MKEGVVEGGWGDRMGKEKRKGKELVAVRMKRGASKSSLLK